MLKGCWNATCVLKEREKETGPCQALVEKASIRTSFMSMEPSQVRWHRFCWLAGDSARPSAVEQWLGPHSPFAAPVLSGSLGTSQFTSPEGEKPRRPGVRLCGSCTLFPLSAPGRTAWSPPGPGDLGCHCTPEARSSRSPPSDSKMCGCILRKSRPCLLSALGALPGHDEAALWPPQPALLSSRDSRPHSVSATSGENYEWGTNEEFHHLFTFTDQWPSFNLPGTHSFSAAVSWNGLLFEVVVK